MNFEKFSCALGKWSFLGECYDESQNYVFGKDFGEQPLRWLHAMFAPCSEDNIAEYVSFNPKLNEFPYFAEMSVYNGLNCFRGGFFLFGLHAGTGTLSSGLIPWDLVSHNVDDQSLVQKFDGLLIGGKEVSEQMVHFIQTRSGNILFVNEAGEQIGSHSGDFDSFVCQVINSLEESPDWRQHLPE